MYNNHAHFELYRLNHISRNVFKQLIPREKNDGWNILFKFTNRDTVARVDVK